MSEARAVAVLGAGTMGHGIAYAAAVAGLEVRLADASEAATAGALERIRSLLDEGVARGKLSDDARAGALARVRAADLATAVRGADVVVEAVPERLDLKLEVLRNAEADAPDEALLATNTSGLSVTEIQRGTARPARVLGLHFFNPVHAMKLVEVIPGRDTSPEVVARGVAFARQLGKQPITVQDSPGFASSRLGLALGLEAMRMLEEGVASAEDIDTAMELGYRHPMGPLRLTDLVGLDVRLAIAEHLHRTLGERFRPPAILRTLVSEGRLGRKSGRGFYRWDE